MKMKLVTACLFSAFLIAPMASHAYNPCQCVQYIKNRVGDQRAAGNAADMDNYLLRNGYRKVNLNNDIPRDKDVIIFKRSFGRAYSGYGHVGVVSHAYRNADSSISVGVVSANMNLSAFKSSNRNRWYSEYSEYGCDNVTVNMFQISKWKYNAVAVYRKG